MNERKKHLITGLEDDMTPHEAASAAVRTSAQVASDRAAAMAAGPACRRTTPSRPSARRITRSVADLTDELAQMDSSAARARILKTPQAADAGKGGGHPLREFRYRAVAAGSTVLSWPGEAKRPGARGLL
jgi:hypothetical protein